MANIIQKYFNIYFTEIIVGVLVLSIAVVLVSIFYVLLSSTSDVINRKTKPKKSNKIQYTKLFLKGVSGIDLDLKVNKKPNE